MYIFISVLSSTVGLLVDVLQFMMFARAIISWIPGLDESALGNFLFTVTEWIILPVRALFDKLGWGNNMILDIPFFVTFIILAVLSFII